MQQLRLSTETAEQDVTLIHRFLSEESTWVLGISIDAVRTSLANSLNFGGFLGESQVAFARVVSDHATFAYLADVFVLREHRGNGYSLALMSAVFSHPPLQNLRRFLLATSTAHRLYSKFGFAGLANPQAFMEKYTRSP